MDEVHAISTSLLALFLAGPRAVLQAEQAGAVLRLLVALGTARGGSSPEVLRACVCLALREKHKAAACNTVIPKLQPLPVRAKFLWLLNQGRNFEGSLWSTTSVFAFSFVNSSSDLSGCLLGKL